MPTGITKRVGIQVDLLPGMGKLWCYRVPSYPCIFRNKPPRYQGSNELQHSTADWFELRRDPERTRSLQTLIQRVCGSAGRALVQPEIRIKFVPHFHLCLYVPPIRNDNMLGTWIAILLTCWGEGNERTIPPSRWSELVIYYYVSHSFKTSPLHVWFKSCGWRGGLEI